ncbi:MAG: nuclear transport factor 2 family protein [Pyrinomonadaceae bacterium MAG19_C2-C3]|nr:nuclear transport factor 2 family protein [Pyrinomonadaceae bacterium MAG19_C2-C3]
MSKEVADKFVEALRGLEDNRDLEAIVGLYAEGCEVGNVVAPEKFHGAEGARKFWTTYRDTFGEVKSEFRNVFATEQRAALEWVTDGTSTNGEAIHYEGVTLLEINGDRVTRSRAYFDAGGLGRQIVKEPAHAQADASLSE